MLSYSDNLISLNARFLVADVQIPGSKSGEEALKAQLPIKKSPPLCYSAAYHNFTVKK